MKINQANLYRYRLPLRYALPLKGSFLTAREGYILELQAEGRFGYGEAAPLDDFSIESLTEVAKQLHAFCENPCAVQDESGWYPSVRFAVESAFWSLQQESWLPEPPQSPLLQGDTAGILTRLKNWQGSWPEEFKLKIGLASSSADIDRINQVIRGCPDHVRLRLDANQRWSLAQAIDIGRQLDTRRIAYVEEPTSDYADFTEFFRETGVFYALDETVQNPDYSFATQPGLAALVLKPTLVGGLNRCSGLIEAAWQHDVRTIFSSTFESSVGIHSLQQLSACWTPDELPGLDTRSAFIDSLVTDIPSPGKPMIFNKAFVVDEYRVSSF